VKESNEMDNIHGEFLGQPLLRWGSLAALVVVGCLVGIGIVASIMGI
jgi:hypothetical protein